MDSLSLNTTKEPTDTRFLVLRGLPFALCDSPTDFYKVCFDSDDDYSFHHLDIGIILTEHEGDVLSSSLRLNPASLKIIIEGDFVMDSIEDLSKAVHSVWTYALHLNYPKSMKNTFQIIQQVLLMLGHSELKPRLQTLKNCPTMLGNARSFHEKSLVFCRTRH
ncbi:hypothetical protein G5714_006305 [Onychostoma macrolepis]|uniref:Uncharacterized protein n=1 Tax=Onychostoma macrolepis TaxID=369639 RepID=A0A7J6D3G6_9TELE|nr:hypothetical protein G5714_006305 [Onychostoma macrolepis]